MANLVNDVEYYVIVMGNTTAGVSFCQDPDFPVLGSVCTTVTPTAPQGVFAPMPLYAVILVALVVVLLPLTFLLANYRYEVACLAAESCPESRPRTTFCAAIADQPLLLLPHPSRRWKYTGLRCGMCWTRTRRIYEAKAVTRSLSHARVSINEYNRDS